MKSKVSDLIIIYSHSCQEKHLLIINYIYLLWDKSLSLQTHLLPKISEKAAHNGHGLDRQTVRTRATIVINQWKKADDSCRSSISAFTAMRNYTIILLSVILILLITDKGSFLFWTGLISPNSKFCIAVIFGTKMVLKEQFPQE